MSHDTGLARDAVLVTTNADLAEDAVAGAGDLAVGAGLGSGSGHGEGREEADDEESELHFCVNER